MASQPARRVTRRATRADVESERRGWLSHGLLALGISALGLAAAGSFASTTNAQPLPAKSDVTRAVSSTTRSVEVIEPPLTGAQTSVLSTYAPRGESAAGTDGTPALRIAVMKEQAAQRAEELAKGAEGITRATQTASSDARQNQLVAANRASREAAKRLSEERLRRAIAARLAASADRQASESAPLSGTTTPDLSTIPTGGGGVSPVPGAVIGAHFGQYGVWSRYHTGLDFRAAYGTPIRAVKAGVVVFAGNSGDWAGNHVAIRHGDSRTTMSSHMSSMAVSSGQAVQAGQVIGYVGQTGRAFGAHLHFELYPAGVRHGDVYKAINPQPWLAANGVRTN